MDDYSQILYIDPPDDLNIVKEKISKTNKEKVTLVLPEENKNLRNIENLTILQKEAQKLDKKISIFSTDNHYRKLAEDCGIPIEYSLVGGSFLNKKGEVSFRPPVSDIVPKQEDKKEEKEFLSAETEKKEKKKEEPEISKEKEKEPKEEKKSIWKRKISSIAVFYAFILLSMIGGVIFAFFWLPKADITLIPVSETVEFSGTFEVKKNAEFNLEEEILPGVTKEKEEEIEKTFASSKEQEKEEKATGKITVYSKDTSPNRFIPGSRFRSKNGKIFKSQDWISIPAGSSSNPATVEITVVAEKAGESYNIGPTTFTLPGLKGTSLYDKVYAKSTKSMSGGFSGITKVVTQEDIKNATKEMKALQEKAAEEALNKLFKNLPDNFQFLEDVAVFERSEIIFDKEPGDIGDNFKGTASVKVKILTFEEKDIQKIISSIVSEKVKDGIKFKELLNTQNIQYELLNGQNEEENLYIGFEGTEKIAWKIEEGEVKKEIMGKTPSEFQEYFKKEMAGKIKDSKVSLWPFWVNRIPTCPDRVKIRINYQ